MPGTRIRPLDFTHGLEDVDPIGEIDRPVLPPSETLRPSPQGPASPVEELIRADTLADVVDACIRPDIADLGICRPERYGALLAQAHDILADVPRGSADPDLEDLAAVLEQQGDLHDLLGYYLQSLLNA